MLNYDLENFNEVIEHEFRFTFSIMFPDKLTKCGI